MAPIAPGGRGRNRPPRADGANLVPGQVRIAIAIILSASAISVPILLTVDEAAELLRTTRRAIYMMLERHQLPGVTRIGRRVLFRSADLLNWLDQKRAPSPEE